MLSGIPSLTYDISTMANVSSLQYLVYVHGEFQQQVTMFL